MYRKNACLQLARFSAPHDDEVYLARIQQMRALNRKTRCESDIRVMVEK